MTDDDATAAAGFGLAGFLLSLNSLGQRVRAGELKMEDAADILARSQHFLTSGMFPGDKKSAAFAGNALRLAEQMLTAATAQKPPTGAN